MRWGYNAAHNLCYLVLDQEAITVLRLAASPPPPLPARNPLSVGTDDWCWLKSDGNTHCRYTVAVYEHNEMPSALILGKDARFITISVGLYAICGVHLDQTIACWQDVSGQQRTDVPEGSFTDVSVSNAHACGVRLDQSIVCWGDNHSGRADPPDGRFLNVSTGQWHSCGLRADHTITCWGDNHGGRADPPNGSFVKVSARNPSYSCGLRFDQTISCWGQVTANVGPPAGQFMGHLSRRSSIVWCPDGP